MGASGALIMSFFGAGFFALTLFRELHARGLVVAAPFLVFVAIAVAAKRVLDLPGQGVQPSERTGRVILWSSIGEGVGLFIAGNVVANVHRPEWLLPAMALVVGLHFVPIAISSALRAFYGLAAALIVAAIVGFVVSPSIAGFAAALSLWVASVLAVLRDRRAKQHM